MCVGYAVYVVLILLLIVVMVKAVKPGVSTENYVDTVNGTPVTKIPKVYEVTPEDLQYKLYFDAQPM